jgi:hypothetical protein
MYSPEFTRSISRAIAEQAALPYDKSEHERRVEDKVARFTTDGLWKLCQVQCAGGD